MKDKQVIYLVDDHNNFLKSMESHLRSDKYDIVLLNDGYYLFAEMEKRKPSLIILDMQMPKLGGIEACRIIKNHAEYKDIPIIISTGTDDSIEEQKVRMLGASEYIVKPYNVEKLNNMIKNYLNIK